MIGAVISAFSEVAKKLGEAKFSGDTELMNKLSRQMLAIVQDEYRASGSLDILTSLLNTDDVWVKRYSAAALLSTHRDEAITALNECAGTNSLASAEATVTLRGLEQGVYDVDWWKHGVSERKQKE